MEFINISVDNRYIQYENQIIDTQTGFRFSQNSLHPAMVCEMFKHQFSYSYKMKLMESSELFSKMKQLIYPLIEHNRDVVLEYEVRYGMNLIYESPEKFNFGTQRLIEESWDFVKTKVLIESPLILEGWWDDIVTGVSNTWNAAKGAVSGAVDAAKGAVGGAVDWVVDKVKEAGQWILNKGLPWFFTKLEQILLNPVAIGVDIALSTIGVGKIAGAILWGALGIWKIYQLVSGQIPNELFSYVDIGLCLVGLAFTGGAANGIKSAMKAAGRDTRKLLSSPLLKPLITLLSKGVSFIMNLIVKPIEWLAKTIGGPKINEMIQTAKGKISNIFKTLDEATKASQPGLRKTIAKGVSQDFIKPGLAASKNPALLKTAAKKGVVGGLALHGGVKAIEKGAEKYMEYQTQKMEKLKADLANTLDDNSIKQTVKSSFDDAMAQMNSLDNQ
jgi:hypothetical protein